MLKRRNYWKLIFSKILICYFTLFHYYFLKDILCKIKTLLVDEKKHIRFGEWNANEVSTIDHSFIFLSGQNNFFIFNSRSKSSINIFSSRRNRLCIWLTWQRKIILKRKINGKNCKPIEYSYLYFSFVKNIEAFTFNNLSSLFSNGQFDQWNRRNLFSSSLIFSFLCSIFCLPVRFPRVWLLWKNLAATSI